MRLQIIIDAGWRTEEELVAWYPSVALRLLAVRDAIRAAWPGAEAGAAAVQDMRAPAGPAPGARAAIDDLIRPLEQRLLDREAERRDSQRVNAA